MKKFNWVKNLSTKTNPNDDKKTPEDLVKNLIPKVPLQKDDFVLDAFAGDKVWFNNYPPYVEKDWCEIKEDRDFFEYPIKPDWVVSNPPYSQIAPILLHLLENCKKGFALLIGQINLSPQRIQTIHNEGFKISLYHICNVRGWFGKSVFLVVERGFPTDYVKFTIDTHYYLMPNEEGEEYAEEQKKYQAKYWKERKKKAKEIIDNTKNKEG